MSRPPSTRMTGVVFDLDGTLLDTMTVAPDAYVDTIRTLSRAGSCQHLRVKMAEAPYVGDAEVDLQADCAIAETPGDVLRLLRQSHEGNLS